MRCLINLYLGLKLRHLLAANHQIGDLCAGFVAFAEICGLGSFDQNGEMVAHRQRVDDVMRDEDDGDALFARLLNNAHHVCCLFDAKGGCRFVQDQNAGAKVDGAGNGKAATRYRPGRAAS
jgi:hypothetical protein